MTHQQRCVQKFQLGPLGPVGPIANSNCFEKRSSLEPVGSDLWLTLQDSSLFRLAIGRPSCAPTPFTALCLPFLTPQPCLCSVKNSLCPWTSSGGWLDCWHYIWAMFNTSSPQRRRTHMRMSTWSGRVWAGSLVCWRATDLGPPWTRSWTLHLR